MTAKNPQKQGRILEGGGTIFLAGQNLMKFNLFEEARTNLQLGIILHTYTNNQDLGNVLSGSVTYEP